MKYAIFTIVKDEPTFLPLWLAHHSKWFDPADIYVLDHQSTDGSTDRPGFVRIVVKNDKAFDHAWLSATVSNFQNHLQRTYDVVVFVEVDEFLFVDPTIYVDGLRSYLESFMCRKETPFVRCNGFEVVQVGSEASIDFSRPLLEQRSTWCGSSLYSKPIVSKVPLRWRNGFHDTDPERDAPLSKRDDSLYLAHLQFIDVDYCVERHATRQKWSCLTQPDREGKRDEILAEITMRMRGGRGEKFRGAETIPAKLKGCL